MVWLTHDHIGCLMKEPNLNLLCFFFLESGQLAGFKLMNALTIGWSRVKRDYIESKYRCGVPRLSLLSDEWSTRPARARSVNAADLPAVEISAVEQLECKALSAVLYGELMAIVCLSLNCLLRRAVDKKTYAGPLEIFIYKTILKEIYRKKRPSHRRERIVA